MAYTLKVFTTYQKINGKNASFQITVDTLEQADSHAKMIFTCGYRRTIDADTYEWIPPHSISRIEISGPGAGNGYQDVDITV